MSATASRRAVCAASLAMAHACVGLLLLQSIRQIRSLRSDLVELQRRVEEHQVPAGRDPGHPWSTRGQGGWRGTRDVRGPSRRKMRQTKSGRAFLHLLPVSSHSDDEKDCTVVKWAPSQSQGLLVSGETITVVTGGPYFIYSQVTSGWWRGGVFPKQLRCARNTQVLYKNATVFMGHVISKSLNGAGGTLMKCFTSMPERSSISSKALNSCFTAGVHFLESGSVLELNIPRKSAEVILKPHSTFLGIFHI
ncbi:tumor necrosis factor ligand superfamily member 13 isoform X2 [Denticeps clupeoides]|uniref:tumor necrosis factor ligand superfamily member 13 isoform X2 n=1 Tax=Denticeps clupeoides TaxID=299321 RepID=UPI0010A30609|nr:tumor necrosis factor ligand superfamily member 13-like isoform X2 [Denticeps clupeoides]